MIEGKTPSRGGRDRVVWNINPQGTFSVKTLREMIGERSKRSGHGEESFWLKGLPRNVNIFVWRMKLERLPTREALDKLRIDIDSLLCPRCGTEVETVNHALFTC